MQLLHVNFVVMIKCYFQPGVAAQLDAQFGSNTEDIQDLSMSLDHAAVSWMFI